MHLPYLKHFKLIIHVVSDTREEAVYQRADEIFAFHEKAPRYIIASETHQRGNDEVRLDLPVMQIQYNNNKPLHKNGKDVTFFRMQNIEKNDATARSVMRQSALNTASLW